MSHAQIVICGAGIAGIAAAHRLALHHRIKDIVLVDERSPLSLTSDKSTEAYRNWWPGPGDAMVRFMNRSIDLLEELAEHPAMGVVILPLRDEEAGTRGGGHESDDGLLQSCAEGHDLAGKLHLRCFAIADDDCGLHLFFP